MKVMILNPYVFTLGGGEKQMGYLCKFIEDYYHYKVEIDIVVYNIEGIHDYEINNIDCNMLNEKFGLNLKCTRILIARSRKPHNKIEFLIKKRKIEGLTKKYDLFINFSFMSKHEGRAKKNIYECMFPPKRFVHEMNRTFIQRSIAKYFDDKFIQSYDMFLSNSEYTKEWLVKYWGMRGKKYLVAYPPVFEFNDANVRYNESEKENIILSVGRFFKGAHCKKQKELVIFFINNLNIFKDYELHLVGSVSDMKEDKQYLKEIKEISESCDNIWIHENCEYNKLLELYKKSKIFWHATGYKEKENESPEKMEHFGITTVEAMSYGAVPVVIAKGGQKEIVDEGINGFLWSNEEECITKTKFLLFDANRINFAKAAVEKSSSYSVEQFNKSHNVLFKKMGL